ncbi:MAG: hypothetical protein KF873_23530 [Gemmataceae bacterium]|nr:hypothetical protein [Gemmataceae bacterium]
MSPTHSRSTPTGSGASSTRFGLKPSVCRLSVVFGTNDFGWIARKP